MKKDIATYVKRSMASLQVKVKHKVLMSIASDRDAKFTSIFWKNFQVMLKVSPWKGTMIL